MAITVATNVCAGDRYSDFHHGGFVFSDVLRAVRYGDPMPDGILFQFIRADADYPLGENEFDTGFNWALFCWFAKRSPYGGRLGIPYAKFPPESRAAFDRAFCTPSESSRRR